MQRTFEQEACHEKGECDRRVKPVPYAGSRMLFAYGGHARTYQVPAEAEGKPHGGFFDRRYSTGQSCNGRELLRNRCNDALRIFWACPFVFLSEAIQLWIDRSSYWAYAEATLLLFARYSAGASGVSMQKRLVLSAQSQHAKPRKNTLLSDIPTVKKQSSFQAASARRSSRSLCSGAWCPRLRRAIPSVSRVRHAYAYGRGARRGRYRSSVGRSQGNGHAG